MKRDTLARNAPRKNSLSAITARLRVIGQSIAISRRKTMDLEEAVAVGLGELLLALVEEEMAVDGGLVIVIETITTATLLVMGLGVQHGRIIVQGMPGDH